MVCGPGIAEEEVSMRGLFRIGFALCVGSAALTLSAAGQIGGIKVPKVPKVPTVPTTPTTTAPAPALAAEPARPAGSAGTADTAGTAKAPAGPGQGAWVNFDVQPGVIPLYVDDFSKDRVGNFPKRLEFRDGSMEVAEWNGARYLRTTTRYVEFAVVLPEVLPDRFTIEFDATPSVSNIEASLVFDPAAPSKVVHNYRNI
jgi:hypothetical protein